MVIVISTLLILCNSCMRTQQRSTAEALRQVNEELESRVVCDLGTPASESTVGIDIELRKRIKQALQKAKCAWAVLNAIPDGIVRFSATKMIVIQADPGFQRFLV